MGSDNLCSVETIDIPALEAKCFELEKELNQAKNAVRIECRELIPGFKDFPEECTTIVNCIEHFMDSINVQLDELESISQKVKHLFNWIQEPFEYFNVTTSALGWRIVEQEMEEWENELPEGSFYRSCIAQERKNIDDRLKESGNAEMITRLLSGRGKCDVEFLLSRSPAKIPLSIVKRSDIPRDIERENREYRLLPAP